jgi:hypothetical protein
MSSPISRNRPKPQGFGKPVAPKSPPKTSAPKTPVKASSHAHTSSVPAGAPKESLATKAKGWVKAGQGAVNKLKSDVADSKKIGFKAAIQKGTAELKKNITNPKVDLSTGAGKFAAARTLGGAIYQAATLPKKVATAASDVRKAVRTRNGSDIAKAVKSSAAAASGAIQTAHKGATAGVLVHKTVSAYNAAGKAFKAAAPHASKAVVDAAARAAAKSSLAGATKQTAKHAIEGAARLATKQAGVAIKTVAGSGTRAAAKAVTRSASEAAAKAALKAGAKTGASVFAKAAGRFAPGVNVAVAALDVVQAGATLADRNASMGKKVTSVITAVGSVVSATNIPGVSQIGAGVALVSGIVGGFFK